MHVVYNSFMGRFSDNPRAVYERLRTLARATRPTRRRSPPEVATWQAPRRHPGAHHRGRRAARVAKVSTRSRAS